MSKTNMICVGGPLHGQRKMVEPGRSWFEVAELPPMEAVSNLPPDDVKEKTIAYKRHIYEREVIGAGENSITFWRHSEMPVGQVAYYLLNDLSENEPHARAAALEWAMKQVREIVLKKDPYSRETFGEIFKIVNGALRPASQNACQNDAASG